MEVPEFEKIQQSLNPSNHMSFEDNGDLTYSLQHPQVKEKNKKKYRNKSQANPQSMMLKVNELNSKI